MGAVTYLNARPLVFSLARFAPQAEIVIDLPSRLADALAAGRLDVAMIPSIEYARHPGYTIVSDACIACDGAVQSVKLYGHVPFQSLRTLALDEGSRTSAALVPEEARATATILSRSRYVVSGVEVARAEMDVNYFGLLRLAQEFAPVMRSRGADGQSSATAWVNLLSVYALTNFPPHGTFSASKAAARPAEDSSARASLPLNPRSGPRTFRLSHKGRQPTPNLRAPRSKLIAGAPGCRHSFLHAAGTLSGSVLVAGDGLSRTPRRPALC